MRTKDDAPVVLVVEDSEDNRELFAAVLRAAGYLVRTAPDGLEALAIASVSPPDVVVTDLTMPAMDGYETMRRLRADLGDRPHYVIVVSALNDRDTRDAAAAAGADAFLGKPCTPAALIAAVEKGMAVVRALTDSRRA